MYALCTHKMIKIVFVEWKIEKRNEMTKKCGKSQISRTRKINNKYVVEWKSKRTFTLQIDSYWNKFYYAWEKKSENVSLLNRDEVMMAKKYHLLDGLVHVRVAYF